MQPLTTLLLLPLTATALSIPRAGGPAIVPIPPTCPTSDPTTSLPSTYRKPSPDLLTTSVYSYYGTINATTCASQCYGYGNPGTCKAVVMAENAPTPAGYYGTPGGVLMGACVMFGREVREEDFVPAEEGVWTDVRGVNIGCTRSA